MNTYKLILVALFFSVAVSMSGQETSVNKESNSLGHRYRAFVEMNGKYDLGEFDFSTTHGYQFNPNLYAGLGYSYGAVIGGYFSYVHADIRYDFTFKEKITPFADLRVSFNKEGVIVQPAIGYRYKHINLSVRYWIGKDDNTLTFGIGMTSEEGKSINSRPIISNLSFPRLGEDC